ncbi:hypothetical protein [Marinobacter bohaiensis]|uniref:hypothetical protein n=1 Tax=Marinobacter bohaiensis TaxID=2201898 RepID=UPI000DACFAA4|nr:hypothetical protein [Marinobacter bohaiensis]
MNVLDPFVRLLGKGWNGLIWKLMPFLLAGAGYWFLGPTEKTLIATVFFGALTVMFAGIIIEGLKVGYFGLGTPIAFRHRQPVKYWIQMGGAIIVAVVSLVCAVFLGLSSGG